MKIDICDLCGRRVGFKKDLKVKIKVKKKMWCDSSYENIDICSFCAEEIIKASLNGKKGVI